MTITATFSNGFTDTYKGTRAVKAAWMITRKSDGKVLASGHSLDTDKARKTAEGKLAYFTSDVLGRVANGSHMRPTRDARQAAFWNAQARKEGYADWAEAYAAYQFDVAAARELMAIEIVAL